MALQSQALAVAAMCDAMLLQHGCAHQNRIETTGGGDQPHRSFMCLDKECGVEWSEPWEDLQTVSTFTGGRDDATVSGGGGTELPSPRRDG